MASFEIILGAAPLERARSSTTPRPAPSQRVELVVHGERLDAASSHEHTACLLRELATAALALLEGRRRKARVPLGEEAWELCLVRDANQLNLSVYRAGPVPEVRVLDRAVKPKELARELQRSMDLLEEWILPEFTAQVRELLSRVSRAALAPSAFTTRPEPSLLRWRSRGDESTALRVALEAMIPSELDDQTGAAQADLHALLFPGRLLLSLRDTHIELPRGFVFLQLERLIAVSRATVDAVHAGRQVNLRAALGSGSVGFRTDADGQVTLSVLRPGGGTVITPGVSLRDAVGPLADAALTLCREAGRSDRSLQRNLRLGSLRTEARGLRRELRDLDRVGHKVNEDPERYRASVLRPTPTSEPGGGIALGHASRVRYTRRWSAEIEGLDLGGAALVGEALVLPGVRELFALDRKTGEALWTRPTTRAATTVAGGDILRMNSRGDVELLSLENGETRWSTRVNPRVGAPGQPLSVNAPGLPRIVVLPEGERHLVALDLRSGEPLWRFTSRGGGSVRLRRHGRLLVVTSSEGGISAVDLTTGELVWRYTCPRPFLTTPAIHQDTVVAVSGSPRRGAAQVIALDVYSGAQRWIANHESAPASAVAACGDVVAVAVLRRESYALAGYGLSDGQLRFERELSNRLPEHEALSLAGFDNLFVANTPSGMVCAVQGQTGAVQWSRGFPVPTPDSMPRRLDVQLRAGALFVPQSSLAVLRPSDGGLVANLEACDLVPDVVRVDEQCAVYVGEESGHVGCYDIGSRLTLLRPVP